MEDFSKFFKNIQKHDLGFFLGSAAITQKQVKPKVLPDVNKMNFQLKSCRGNYFIPIKSPELLLTHPAFNVSRKTAVLVTGWFSNVNSTMENEALESVWEAYKCRGDTNFVVSDEFHLLSVASLF